MKCQLLGISYLSTTLSVQTPNINDALSWEARTWRPRSLDVILHVWHFEAQRHTKQQLTPRTRLIWPLSLLFFHVSDLAIQISILFRCLFRTWRFVLFCGHGEGDAATGCLPSHHTTGGSEPSFHQLVLLFWTSPQQLVRQYYVSFNTSHSWAHWCVFACYLVAACVLMAANGIIFCLAVCGPALTWWNVISIPSHHTAPPRSTRSSSMILQNFLIQPWTNPTTQIPALSMPRIHKKRRMKLFPAVKMLRPNATHGRRPQCKQKMGDLSKNKKSHFFFQIKKRIS